MALNRDIQAVVRFAPAENAAPYQAACAPSRESDTSHFLIHAPQRGQGGSNASMTPYSGVAPLVLE